MLRRGAAPVPLSVALRAAPRGVCSGQRGLRQPNSVPTQSLFIDQGLLFNCFINDNKPNPVLFALYPQCKENIRTNQKG